MPVNVVVKSLSYHDGSSYAGQVKEIDVGSVPHGFGSMVTADGFEMLGYFKNGKSCGIGRFTAPNGDRFYGYWNSVHRREGQGLFVKADEDKQLIEVYADGALRKRIRMARKLSNTMYWLPTPPFEYGVGSPPQGPCPRTNHTAVLAGTPSQPRVVLLGGRTTHADGRPLMLGDLWVLDLLSVTWLQPPVTGTAPPPLHSHACVVAGKILYVLGGLTDAMETSATVYALDLERMHWYVVPCGGPAPVALAGHTATLLRDSIYVTHGRAIFALDLASHTWRNIEPHHAIRCAPRALTAHAAVAHEGLLYVFGGEVGVSQTESGVEFPACSSEVRVFDPDTETWSTIRPRRSAFTDNYTPPASTTAVPGQREAAPWEAACATGALLGDADTARAQHAAVMVSADEVLLVGGWTCRNPSLHEVDRSYLADVLVFNLRTHEWRAPWIKYPVCPPRGGHTAVCALGWVWVMGGTNYAVGDRGMWELSLLHVGPDAREST